MNSKADAIEAAISGSRYQVNNPIRDYLYLDIDRVRGVSIVVDSVSLRPKEKTLCRRAVSTRPSVSLW